MCNSDSSIASTSFCKRQKCYRDKKEGQTPANRGLKKDAVTAELNKLYPLLWLASSKTEYDCVSHLRRKARPQVKQQVQQQQSPQIVTPVQIVRTIFPSPAGTPMPGARMLDFGGTGEPPRRVRNEAACEQVCWIMLHNKQILLLLL